MTYLIRYLPPREGFADNATPDELAVINEHFAYLAELHAGGRLILAGRAEDASFGIALLDTRDETEARDILSADPAVQSGIFSADLIPFRRAVG